MDARSADGGERRILVAVRDPRLRARLARLLAEEGVDIEFTEDEGRALVEGADADAVLVAADELGDDEAALLSEATEPDAPGVVVLGEEGGPDEQARLIAAGASAVLDATAKPDELREQLVELIEAEAAGGLDGPEAGGMDVEPKLADFHSRSATMKDFVETVRRVSATESTLLVTGETGVGKERLARAIHAESARRGGPFVSVNCGALPENLLESELFGHEKGAFTGATERRAGRFESAGGGTLFLDEIGEMPLHLQVSLLTVLQRREVRRLGGGEPVPIDVRVIAATNRNLEEDVAEGRFREDLFYRLNVVSLKIPPLRERREDLPQLLGRFLRHFSTVHGRDGVAGFDAAAMAALMEYDWPGNVREVANVVERAVLLTEGESVGPADLPDVLRPGASPAGGAPASGSDPELFQLPLNEAKRRVVEAFEKEYIEHLLGGCAGRVGDVAERARINPRTLYAKMRLYGLNKEDYRG